MVGPANAILGNVSSPVDMPAKATEEINSDRSALKSAAAFSKSAEFQQLKQLIDAKIEAWGRYVPGPSGEILAGDRVDVAQLGNEERGWRWLAANQVINELTNLVAAYEQAEELLRDEATQ